MASQIISSLTVCSTVCSSYKKHQNPTLLRPFWEEIYPWLLDSPHKGPVIQKALPRHDVIMAQLWQVKPARGHLLASCGQIARHLVLMMFSIEICVAANRCVPRKMCAQLCRDVSPSHDTGVCTRNNINEAGINQPLITGLIIISTEFFLTLVKTQKWQISKFTGNGVTSMVATLKN